MRSGERETTEAIEQENKKALEHLEKKKATISWEYWERTP